MSQSDVIVVGTGVVGSSIAYHLARSGGRVTVLGPPQPEPPSASWASAGGVRRQNRDPREWPLTIRAAERWPSLEDELGADGEVRFGGHLHVAGTEADLEELAASAARQQAGGIDVDVVDAATARELAPILTPDIAGGLFSRGDGQANPRLVTAAFLRAAVRHGADHRPDAVSGFVRTGDTVVGVRTGGEEVRARWVVIAAGPWSVALTRHLGVELPIRVDALQMLRTDAAPPALAPTVGFAGRAISFKQLPTGSYFIGGGWPGTIAADERSASVIEESVRGSWETAVATFPSLAGRTIADRWCGLEGTSMDGAPFIGPVPGVPGAYVAAGFSGHGFQLSPATGEAVARELGGGAPGLLAPLTATRLTTFTPEQITAFRSTRTHAAAG